MSTNGGATWTPLTNGATMARLCVFEWRAGHPTPVGLFEGRVRERPLSGEKLDHGFAWIGVPPAPLRLAHFSNRSA